MNRRLPASVYRRRRVAAAAALVLLVALLVAGVRALWFDDDEGDGARATAGGPAPTTSPTSASTVPMPSTTTPTGRFTVAAGRSAVVGGPGRLVRYRVEVEQGTGVDPEPFAAIVEAVLADPRGWTTADGIAVQRVDSGPVDLAVRLATPATTDLLCHPLDTGGQVSCGRNAMAVLNLTRWQQGAEPSGLGLDDYRRYLVSHEVGHLLGHVHVDCPGPGLPAPVMMQQTLSIGSCTPNPWPVPPAEAAGG